MRNFGLIARTIADLSTFVVVLEGYDIKTLPKKQDGNHVDDNYQPIHLMAKWDLSWHQMATYLESELGSLRTRQRGIVRAQGAFGIAGWQLSSERSLSERNGPYGNGGSGANI